MFIWLSEVKSEQTPPLVLVLESPKLFIYAKYHNNKKRNSQNSSVFHRKVQVRMVREGLKKWPQLIIAELQ